MFKPEFFIRNRKTLQQQSKSKVLIIAAHTKMQRSADSHFSFRQDSYFWYLCGVELAGAVLVITPSETFLITPYQDRFDVIAEGTIDVAALCQRSGVDRCLDYRQGWEQLKKILKNEKTVGVLGTKSRREHNVTVNGGRMQLQRKLRRLALNVAFEDVRSVLVAERMIKQPEEIKAMQRAIAITCTGLAALAENLQAMNYEYEAEAFLSARFRQHGATDAYTPIVASGGNACAIHYTSNNQKIARGELLLIDMGAELTNYTSDITRTFAVGDVSTRHTEVLEAVADVQRYAYSLIKPGVNRREYELAIENYMGDILVKLGLITAKTRPNIRRYFTHATSHYLGLDVHDVADYTKPFAENMVLTVEPGIYIPEENIGVRIEDDVIVTKNGIRVMSQDLPAIIN